MTARDRAVERLAAILRGTSSIGVCDTRRRSRCLGAALLAYERHNSVAGDPSERWHVRASEVLAAIGAVVVDPALVEAVEMADAAARAEWLERAALHEEALVPPAHYSDAATRAEIKLLREWAANGCPDVAIGWEFASETEKNLQRAKSALADSILAQLRGGR